MYYSNSIDSALLAIPGRRQDNECGISECCVRSDLMYGHLGALIDGSFILVVPSRGLTCD